MNSRSSRLAATALTAAMALAWLPGYWTALAAWRDTSSLQARIDSAMSARPDVRLGFARPAVHEFLAGHYAESEQRLRAGFARFGAHPELAGAARYIEETRTALIGGAGDPPMPPYAFMHRELARQHRAAGHDYAARVHADFGRALAAVRPGAAP